MAIKLYTGRTGSGKSYNSVANVIIPALKEGRTVVTNVVLKKSKIFEDYPDANILNIPFGITHENVADYLNLENYPKGAVYVIDEGAKIFPTGQKVTNIKSTLLTFFTEHRHNVGPNGYSAEIFVLAQDSSQLSKFIRDLVDTTYHHVKLDKHGMANTFRVDIYDGSVSGAAPRGEVIESKLGKYKDEYTQYYKSHTQQSSSADTALEASPDKRGTNTKTYLYALLAVPAVLLAAFFAFSSFSNLFSSGDVTSEPQFDNDQTMLAETKTVTFEQPIKARNDKLMPSDDWRLSGIINSRNGMVAIIESEDRSRTLNALSSCEYDRDIKEWYCHLNGELIASYTGPVFEFEEDSGPALPFTD